MMVVNWSEILDRPPSLDGGVDWSEISGIPDGLC